MEVPNAPSGVGVDSNSGSSVTSGVKLRHRKAMTVKNLAAYFFNNGDHDTVPVHSRKNGANGNLNCNIASQSNVLGQDTSIEKLLEFSPNCDRNMTFTSHDNIELACLFLSFQ